MPLSPAKEQSHPEPTCGFFPDRLLLYPNLGTQGNKSGSWSLIGRRMQVSLEGFQGLGDLTSDYLSTFSPSFLIRVNTPQPFLINTQYPLIWMSPECTTLFLEEYTNPLSGLFPCPPGQFLFFLQVNSLGKLSQLSPQRNACCLLFRSHNSSALSSVCCYCSFMFVSLLQTVAFLKAECGF